MSLVRALGRKSPSWFFNRASINGQVTSYSSAMSDVQYRDSSQVKPFKDIPGPRGLYQWPVIGPLLHFKPFTDKSALHVSRLFTEMLDKYGPIVRMRLRNPVVLISDPKDAEVVFRHEGKYPARVKNGLTGVYAKRNNLNPTLIDVDGEEWYNQRSSLNKRLMRFDSAHHYLDQQNLVADDFIDILASQKLNPDDLSELFFRFACESVGVVCFNSRLGFLDPVLMRTPESIKFMKKSRDMFVYLSRAVSGESVAHTIYRNETYRSYEESRLFIRNQSLKLIEKSKQVLEERKKAGTLDPDEPNLLLSLLSDNDLQYEDIVGSIQTLYSAGTDSTAKNLIVLFYHLAKNPDKQEKLREEIFNVLGRNQPVTVPALAKLSYLKAALKESFRSVCPTPSGTGRIVPTDIVLRGYRIPAGIFVQIHTAKSCKTYFEQPDKFLPERWLRSSDGRQIEQFPALASLPFGFGPRNCIGKRFAEQEIHLATAKALQRLKIEIEPESANTTFIHSIFVEPEKPIKFIIKKLDS